MRHALIALSLLLCSLNPAFAQLSINFGVPGASIGIDLPVYPQLQRIPGYPVYYAPAIDRNYFFYDGLYWVYEGDNWYASSWYNGPWGLVDPQDVPLYLLRVPVRYYRQAPSYFRGWNSQDPPRWGEHWGQSWAQRHSGWDRWDRKSAPAPAPLPAYQRQYSGSRYPQASQQAGLETRNYRYQPKDPVAQQHFQQVRAQSSPAAAPQPAQQPRQARPQQAPVAREQQAPRTQTQQAPVAREQQAPRQQAQPLERKPQPAPVAREQQAPRQQAQPLERKPQPAPVAREQQAPRQQPPQIERKPQPPAHEQQARPQAQPKPQQGQEQGKAQGKEQGKAQGKEQGKEQDNKEK